MEPKTETKISESIYRLLVLKNVKPFSIISFSEELQLFEREREKEHEKRQQQQQQQQQHKRKGSILLETWSISTNSRGLQVAEREMFTLWSPQIMSRRGTPIQSVSQ